MFCIFLAGFQKDCIVCMVCNTFTLSQKHTGSSFKASIITNRLSCMYFYQKNKFKFEQKIIKIIF